MVGSDHFIIKKAKIPLILSHSEYMVTMFNLISPHSYKSPLHYWSKAIQMEHCFLAITLNLKWEF